MAVAYGREITVNEIWKMAASKRRQDEKHLKILREFGALPYNKQCFDCHQRGPTYVNMTIGSFVCTSCSGILRGLNPPHRVKSISMASFTAEEIDFIRNKGNEYCRREWMGTYDGQPPIESETKDEQRIKDFMITKYERKRWYTDPSTFRHLPLPSSQLTSPPPPVTVNNIKQNTTTNNITQQISRPVMQSASFPPPSSSGKTSMDLLGDLGVGSTSNANASFANFDNFISASSPVSTTLSVSPPITNSILETASNDDNIPIIGKSFYDRIVGQKKQLGLSFFHSLASKGASRLPSIESKRHSKLKSGVNIKTTHYDDLASSAIFFPGPSNPTHSAATNIIADSAFGGIASTSSNPSSSGVVPPRPPPVSNSSPLPIPPPNQPTLKDRYAALADLDSLFNSSAPSNNASNANPTVEWDVPKSNTSNAWYMNSAFASGVHQIQPAPLAVKEFDRVQTPSNPFTGMNFNSSVWNQKPNVAPAPSPGNPFASSILNQTNAVGSTSPEPFSAFSNPSAVMNSYPVGPTNVGWGNSAVAVPTPFLAATNGNYAGYKTATQPQFGLWQPSVGNPFVAAVVSAPQKSNSSNPFL